MRFKKAIKRIVALGIGATMMGATILGATAAADLASYPSPFIANGKFDGKIVVGNEAKAEDVIGATAIIASLQYASRTSSTSTTGTTTSYTGDAWKVGSSSKKLEMSENLITTASPVVENIRNITQYITASELNALADGSASTVKGTATYSQYIHFDDNKLSGATVTGLVGSEYVMLLKDDNDELADFFYIKNTDRIARYELEFQTSFQADVEDSGGAASTTGTYLLDYEGEILNIIGMDYEIVKARRPASTGGGIALTLMGGAIKTTMEEGATQTFTLDGKEYAVTVSAITDSGTIVAKFNINGESTKSLTEGNSDTLSDGTEIGVTDIMPNEAGDPTGDIVEFYLGAKKVYLKDTAVYDASSSNRLEVGNEKIDDADVIIKGTDDNSTFSIDDIQINVSAGDDYYVPAGGKLSALMKEPQALMNWDIEYKGLSDATTEDIKIKTSGSDQYELAFVDGSGNKATIPLAYTSGSTALKFGDNDDDLVILENNTVTRNDYLIVTDIGQDAGERSTYALRYKGADKSTDESPVVKFQNLGDGSTIEKSHKLDTGSGCRKATITLGGQSYNVYNVSSPLSDNFDVKVDMDGDDESFSCGAMDMSTNMVAITTQNGAQIDISNRTDIGEVQVNISTVDTNDYDNVAPTKLVYNVTASGGEVRIAQTGTVGLYSLKAPEDDKNTQYGYTSLGAKITYSNPSSDPQELTVEYPKTQRTPEVFIASGKVTYSSAGGAVESTTIQKIEVGAAVLASEVSNVAAENLILVGGPCANAAAREVMGVTAANCAEGFEEGKAKLKLYEQSTGKVALLVAGYSAMDTRRASIVLGNYADYSLSGTEVEVSGTSLSQISVSKVA